MKNVFKNIVALLIGTTIAILITEILLNFYNPFGFRLKGDKIVLSTNVKWEIENNSIKGLDSIIVHTKNSLGFRGPEPPKEFERLTSIITIGGSTTECFYLSDGKDWASLLSQKLNKKFRNIWINNAGLDGHSTFGHQILLNDYIIKLKPNYAMFLIGCNDIERSDLNNFDESILKVNSNLRNIIRNNSEVVSLFLNIKRSLVAKSMGVAHTFTNLKTVDFVDSVSAELVKETIFNQQKFQKNYSKRIESLIDVCRKNDIIPILITQPTLVGFGFDDITNNDLGKIKFCSYLGGRIYWEKLEVYNTTKRRIAKSKNIFLIDLASLMPKSSALFYDCVHFTNRGAEVVAEIIFGQMTENLSEDKSIDIYIKKE